MANVPKRPDRVLSGRIRGGPGRVLHDEILGPQFRFEVRHLLPWYVATEKVLALEYGRMRLMSGAQVLTIFQALDAARDSFPVADPEENMSDVAFALERRVTESLAEPIPVWHVDRSRNDLQACAQAMFLRTEVLETAAVVLELGGKATELADRHRHQPMPGYTHYQAAQIITPGYYFASVSEQVLHSLRRMLSTYDGIDTCPLGSGAMAGQELAWDRERMARLLGFRTAQPHALTGVASRRAAQEVTAELSLLGAAISRFTTDLLTWSSSAYGFIELPDELSGISSAMPQKKNYPVLERIRGKSAHLSSLHFDTLLGQRNTPYTNLVEVSKEAGSHLLDAMTSARSMTRLLCLVLEHLVLHPERMLEACEREHLGGFSLANRLTLEEGVPWRSAQVLAGRYIVAALDGGRSPQDTDADLLRSVAAEWGHDLAEPERALRRASDVRGGVHDYQTAGSVHPDAVATLVAAQRAEHQRLTTEWEARAAVAAAVPAEIDRIAAAWAEKADDQVSHIRT